MPQVLMQPVFGNEVATRNWSDTVQREVHFAAPATAAALTRGQLEALHAMYPSGYAQFWGNRANHNRKADRIRTGDVVLFTGNNFAYAIGEVGCSFRNAAFADLLWEPDAVRGSWLNVYSI